MRALVTAHQHLSDDLIKLVVAYDTPQAHRSGQYSVVSVPDVPGKAYFSIASTADEQPQMTFLIRLGSTPLDDALKGLKVGDVVHAEPPSGRFVPAGDGDHLLFVGGGTGIAPMLAMTRQLVCDGDPRRLGLIYGLRSLSEVGFESELQALSQAGVELDLQIGRPITLPEGLDASGLRLHLCGPKAMIEALSAQAAQQGVEQVFTEPY